MTLLELFEWLKAKFKVKPKHNVDFEEPQDYSSDILRFLVSNGKIATIEYQMYILFHLNGTGRAMMAHKMNELFMINVLPEFIPNGLIYLEGQRSVFKEIKKAIDHVNSELNKTR